MSCRRTNDNFIYILSRNSITKEGNMVLQYNLTKTNISHIGLTLTYPKNNTMVYNISYDSLNNNSSSLIAQNVKSFWNSVNPNDNKFWKLSISENEMIRIRYFIDSLQNEKIFFDLDSTTSNGLYCSEFVYNSLVYANKKFSLPKTIKPIKGIAKYFVKFDTLKYFPADFFLQYKEITELR